MTAREILPRIGNNSLINNAKISPPGIVPVLSSPWIYLPSYGGSLRKVGGLVNLYASCSGGTSSSVLMNLPVGYRPANRVINGLVVFAGVGYYAIETNGDVLVYQQTGNIGTGCHIVATFPSAT